MTRAAFVDTAADVALLSASFGAATVIAMTAEAAWALEEAGIPFLPIGKLADTRRLMPVEERLTRVAVDLLERLEAAILRRHPTDAGLEAGFLDGLAYHLQYSLGSIATRTYLMDEALRALDATHVTIAVGRPSSMFAADGYTNDPWVDLLCARAPALGVTVTEVERPTSRPSESPAVSTLRRARSARLRRVMRREIGQRVTQCPAALLEQLRGTRVLVAAPYAYDWEPALDQLRGVRGSEIFRARVVPLDEREWTQHFLPQLQSPRESHDLDLGPLPTLPDLPEQAALESIIDDWLRAGDVPSVAPAGVDLAPALGSHIRAIGAVGRALTRHADAAAERALELTRPDAVLFCTITALSTTRLATVARARGIPVLCFQHGGSYGTHAVTQHELAEFRHADAFLSYGEVIAPATSAFGAPRAQFVPVGSTRLERLRASRRRSRGRRRSRANVLVVGEVSFGNTLGATFVMEDTSRFTLERETLRTLADSRNLRVTYRPFPGQAKTCGVVAWLRSGGAPRVELRDDGLLSDLLGEADVVVTATTSGTVWSEALALDLPLVLYCDPLQTPLTETFVGDLAGACHFCPDRSTFDAAVRLLARDGRAALPELVGPRAADFLRRFAIHRDDGGCVQRALDVLMRVHSGGLEAL